MQRAPVGLSHNGRAVCRPYRMLRRRFWLVLLMHFWRFWFNRIQPRKQNWSREMIRCLWPIHLHVLHLIKLGKYPPNSMIVTSPKRACCQCSLLVHLNKEMRYLYQTCSKARHPQELPAKKKNDHVSAFPPAPKTLPQDPPLTPRPFP